jgi:hypothetical protein
MAISYLIGYTNLLDGKNVYETQTADTPDTALYSLQYTISKVLLEQHKVNIPSNALDEINFISNDIPAIVLNKNLSLECTKNDLEDLQILCYNKITSKGYIYNTSTMQACFNFFLKQVITKELEMTPEVKSLIESFKQLKANTPTRQSSLHYTRRRYPVHKKIKKN